MKHLPLLPQPTRRHLLMLSCAGASLAVSGGLEALAQTPQNAPKAKAGMPATPAPAENARIIHLVAEGHSAPLTNPPANGAAPSPVALFRYRLVDQPEQGGTTPVIRVKTGEVATLVLENRLPFPTSLHLHGLRGENVADGTAGLTETALTPGETRTIPLFTGQAGTFLLTHLDPETVMEANARLLHALLIVEEASPPPVDHDIPLLVTDWRMDETGQMTLDFGKKADIARAGRLGNRMLINAAPSPGSMVVRPGARVRVRLVNGANARILPLAFTNLNARVIAIDSTPCDPFDPLRRTVTLCPGTRVEVMLDMPDKEGDTALIEAKLGEPGAPGFPLFTFKMEGEALPPRGSILTLPAPDLPAEIKLQRAVRAEMTITGGLARDDNADDASLAARFPDAKRIFSINNGTNAGFTGKPLARVKRKQELVLAIANKTAFAQVIAVHGHAFRVLHPYDDGWDPYFLDTLFIAPGATWRIAIVADKPGKWAIRSTIAEHLTGGVATWFEVV